MENIMNLRQVILIYQCNELFLYEIMEDYKDAQTQKDKDDIFEAFCSFIWSCDNKRRIYKKAVRFTVRKDLLHTELGQVFNTWSEIEYKHYKSMTKDENWRLLIRQKINNIYTRYFDREVILAKEYMDLLKTPKRLYYQWISGIDMEAGTVTEMIDDAMDKAQKVKAKLQMEKMSLSFHDYKKAVKGFLRKCFDNCRLIEEYENQLRLTTSLDFLTEDHFYVGYICRYLDREILQFQKKYYGVRQHRSYSRCRQCGGMIEKTGNRRMYCEHCKRIRDLDRYRKYNQKRYHK